MDRQNIHIGAGKCRRSSRGHDCASAQLLQWFHCGMQRKTLHSEVKPQAGVTMVYIRMTKLETSYRARSRPGLSERPLADWLQLYELRLR